MTGTKKEIILAYVAAKREGIVPAYSVIRDVIGVKDNTIAFHVAGLHDKGYLDKLPNGKYEASSKTLHEFGGEVP